jgi:endonuclease/exonuclease/phosphatase family metal-dependent hydrolase
VSLRVLSYNIRHGGVGRETPLAAVINSCSADVVILQEASRPDVVERLATACGMNSWGALRGHSLAYLSRVDVSAPIWHRVPFGRRKFIEITMRRLNMPIFGVHLSAIHSNITEGRRMVEARHILRQVAAKERGFHILTGDFNTLAPGERLNLSSLPLRLRMLTWMTGKEIRWRTVQLMLDAGYIDGYRKLHPEGEAFTFPTWDPHVRLDYFFLPSPFANRLTSCTIVRDAPGVREASDHFPLLAEIRDE